MFKTLTRSTILATLVGLSTGPLPVASAQSPSAPRDDSLDGLLKKLEEKDAGPDDKGTGAGQKNGEKAGPGSGKVSGKDQEIDNLLEKLGATDDKPAADDKKAGPGGPAAPDDRAPKDKPGGEKKGPDPLTGGAKGLDEHLEELTGKRRKKNGREDEGGGPLGDVVKQMREVEERLGKPDTGDETRKKQTQIVKRIETLIEQSRSSSSQSKGKPSKGRPMKPGTQPDQGNQETAGTNGGNAPLARPQKPTDRRSLAGGKDAWGHLPPELRQEMANVFKEEPLPAREELIRRYYLSVSKKTLTRGE